MSEEDDDDFYGTALGEYLLARHKLATFDDAFEVYQTISSDQLNMAVRHLKTTLAAVVEEKRVRAAALKDHPKLKLIMPSDPF